MTVPEVTPSDIALLREVFARPGLSRVLDVFEEKVVRYGGASGRLTVTGQAEADALGGLLGRHLRPGQNVRLAVMEEHLLTETRFRCTLRDVVEAVRGRPLVTRAEARAAENQAWEEVRSTMLGAVAGPALGPVVADRLAAWVRADEPELRRRWRREGPALGRQVADACRCLAVLPADGRSRSLAELATEGLGDPKALDRDGALAPLFDRMLAAVLDVPAPGGSAEFRDEFLAAAGIVRDRTSAKVDSFGLIGQRPDLALLTRYPLRAFSLREIEAMAPDELMAPVGVVHVVENASVFDWLVARLDDLPPENRPALVCTNGWLNLADRGLLRMLARTGAEIRYSGDFDDRGLAIAREVQRAFSHVFLWRMSNADYEAGLPRAAGDLDVDAVAGMLDGFPALAPVMVRHGRVVYQEAIQDLLLTDLRSAGRG